MIYLIYCKNFVNATVYPHPAQQLKKWIFFPMEGKKITTWSLNCILPVYYLMISNLPVALLESSLKCIVVMKERLNFLHPLRASVWAH
jgi:hypothetical protein